MGKKGSAVPWISWDEYQVGSWMKKHGLERYAATFVENGIAGENLPDCLDETMLAQLVDQGFWRKKIMAEISQLVSSDLDATGASTNTAGSESTTKTEGPSSKQLPPGKLTHFFGSHQKEHSVYGDTSESLAIRFKDILEEKFGLKGWFDLDDLKTISQESINEGIRSTCCLLVLLTDETMSSRWCQAEWECARENNVGIFVVVDVDKFPTRALIKSYVEAGFGWLFENQVINYTSSHRKACYGMIAQAIEAVVDKSSDHQKAPPTEAPSGLSTAQKIHGNNMDAESIQAQFKQLVCEKHASTEAFFTSAKGKSGNIGRQDFKVAVQNLGLDLSDAARKQLRKHISEGGKLITLSQLRKFIDGLDGVDASASANDDSAKDSSPSQLSPLPISLPDLPPMFHAREGPLKALISSLVESTTSTVSLTAPKARQSSTKVSSHGMGGCGKTILTIAAVRHDSVRKHFRRIAWAAISQKPNLLEILAQLYVQLSENVLPEDKSSDLTAAFQTIQQFCIGQTFLVVLDDVWDPEVEKKLSFLDESTPSRLLISTRIRGLVKGAKEVQVSLLTSAEAVDMLCLLAELSATENLPSEIMQITRVCGNLPLCISVAAGMIRGSKANSDPQESCSEVLAMLQEDAAGALTDEAEFSVSDLVVGRSVRCLPSDNARDLFAMLGACPEDASVCSGFITILWGLKVGESKSKLRVKSISRKLVAMLVHNNLVQLNADFVTMHDIVRDFSRECIGDAPALSKLQRSIVNEISANAPEGGWEGMAATKDRDLKLYISSHLAHHVSEALGIHKDDIVSSDAAQDALSWLETSDDPFAGPIVLETAKYLGAQVLRAWANKFQTADKKLVAARLNVCAASSTGSGLWMSANAGKGLLFLKEAIVLLRANAYSTLNEAEQTATDTLEFTSCRECYLNIEYSDPDFFKFVDRCVELAPRVSLSPAQKTGLAFGIQLSGQHPWTRPSSSDPYHTDRTIMTQSAHAELKGSRMFAETADQLPDEDPLKVIIYCCGVANLHQGYSNSVWFSDNKEHIAVCSHGRLRFMMDNYSWDIHHEIAKTAGYYFDTYFWTGPAALISVFGDLLAVKKYFNDVSSIPAEERLIATAPLMTNYHYLGSWGHPVCRFAHLGREALQVIKQFNFTFTDVEKNFDCENSRTYRSMFGWETDFFTFYALEFVLEFCRKRHFMLAEHEIELGAFKEALPPITDKYCVNPISTWMTIDDGDVYFKLGKHEEGIRRTKLSLARFPFNCYQVLPDLVGLAGLLRACGQSEEAAECYLRAIKEARRMGLHMVQLYAFCEQGVTEDSKKGIGQVVAKMGGRSTEWSAEVRNRAGLSLS